MNSKKNKKFLKLPLYEGGSDALKKFIDSNLKYPEEALKNNIQGTVHIKYDVDDNGSVLSAKVEKGIGYGCDEEALRLVRMLSYNKAKNIGQRVKSSMKIKIRFYLPQAINLVNNYQYNYIKKENLQKQTNIVYSYTITIDQSQYNE